VVGLELRISGGSDHGGVVGAEGAAGEIGGDAGGLAALLERRAELRVGGYAAGDEHTGGIELLGGEHRAVYEIADDRVLKFAHECERLRGAEREELFEFAFAAFKSFLTGKDFGAVFAVFAEMVEHGSLDAAEAEVERIAARFGGRESYGSGSADGRCGGETIEYRSAGIAEGQELGDFVVGFAGGVVTRLRDFFIGEGWLRGVLSNFIQDRVTTGNDEADGGKLRPLPCFVSFEENRVDVPFEVIYRNERLVQSLGERFRVGDADEQCADEAGALRDADRVDVLEREVGFAESFADYRDDLPEMFARSEFWHDAAVLAVNIDLRSDDAGQDFAAVGHDGGSRFVAGRFDA